MAVDAGASDLGRYRLGRLLGRGGMGEVYLAHDETLGRDVAIKFVASDKVGDEVTGRRLLHEAHAAAVLDHPCICTVYETGRTPDGKAFIVMQYIEGESLSTMLESGPLPVREALGLAANIAEALAAAHKRSIVHRDLKPSNVMVTPSGRPKLLDFGIAKQVVLPASAINAPTSSADVTTAGTIVGTPAYMSPEQIQQRPLDGRSDLFSLGVVLFESLTGRRAFEGPSLYETLANVLHVHPPAPSSLRRELTDRHDELCRRLMAKDASDRFQSAEEVVGAIRLLLPDTSRTSVSSGNLVPPVAPPGLRVSRRAVIAVAAVVVAGVAGVTIYRRPSQLPPVPPEADVWYQRGVEAIRQGAYLSGQRALEQAIRVYPQHVLAYARLADANIELDDERAAQNGLLRVSALAEESSLPELERLRVQAIRAFFLREVDTAVALQRQLVNRQPQDAGTWLDLGRAQEAAGLRSDARESYQTAIERDRQYAPAYLRLGFVEGLGSRRTESLAAFSEAERLYRALSNVEGETEVLLRRGGMYDAIGEGRRARPDLERALVLANGAKASYQQVRIRLTLSSVAASEGRFEEAETMASAAVQDALANGLESIAADGLVDLTATLSELGRLAEARANAERALQLAEQRGARRTVARAKVQLAAVQEAQNQPREALATIDGVLPFLKSKSYRRFELYALSVTSRAHERLDELDQARQISSEALSLAETVKDESQIARAANNLASVTTTLGNHADALRLRERAEAIHKRLGDKASLPYDLANRADLLIRLGRGDEAAAALDEIDRGIAEGLPAYQSRARRLVFLRLFAAGTELRCEEVDRRFLEIPGASEAADAPGVVGPAIADFCRARLRRRPVAIGRVPEGTEPGLVREQAYWRAAAALERAEPGRALNEATRGIAAPGPPPPDELLWRLAAVGSVAARLLNDARAGELSGMSREALKRLRESWKSDFEEYGKRSDVVYLIRRAALA